MFLYLSLAYAGRIVVIPVESTDPAQVEPLTDALTVRLEALEGMTVAREGVERTWVAELVLLCGALSVGNEVRLDCRVNAMPDGEVLASAAKVGRTNALDDLACALVGDLAPALGTKAPACGGKTAPTEAPTLRLETPVTLTIRLDGDDALQTWLVDAFDSIDGVEARAGEPNEGHFVTCRFTGGRGQEVACHGSGVYRGVEVSGRLDRKSRCTTVGLVAVAVGLGPPSVSVCPPTPTYPQRTTGAKKAESPGF